MAEDKKRLFLALCTNNLIVNFLALIDDVE